MKMGRKIKFSVPQEIIYEILKELPVKTLLRLRCVSKLWLSIIDDPLFIESHYNRSINRPDGINLLFLNSPKELYDSNQIYAADPQGRSALPLPSLPRTAKFLPFPLYSVKGLVCFQSCIWNPSTREIKEIPPIRISSPTFDIPLGSNPLKTISFNFLGFDPAASGTTGKFKLLNITRIFYEDDYDSLTQTQFKVLTLSRGCAYTWRDIDHSSVNVNSQLDTFSIIDRERACCINDIIYCLGTIGNHSSTYCLGTIGNHPRTYVILAFQVRDESFKIMPLPQGAAKDYFFAIQVRERLALINSKVTEIWILEDYDKQLWNKQILNLAHIFFDGKIPIVPICSIGGEILFQYSRSKFFYYDLETETTRRKFRKLSKLVSSTPFFLTSYVESLF